MLALRDIDVIILCGGLGKRLRSVVGKTQKVLAEIDGKPFLEILISYFASQGSKRFILATGHDAQTVEEHFKKTFPQLSISFSREDEPLGTGGAIKFAQKLVQSDIFFALNGDCFTEIDLKEFLSFHLKKKAQASLAISKVKETGDFGSITIDIDKSILAFEEKVKSERPSYVSTGIYCLNKNVFSLVKTDEKFSIEYDFFPKLVTKGFYGFVVDGNFIDIGTPERYQWAKENLNLVSSMKKLV